MSHDPITLTEIDELVFDTNEYDNPWYYKDPYAGVPVETSRLLDEVTVSFYFVIPEIVTEDDAPLKILTVARGLPGNSMNWPTWRDPVRLREFRGGTYAAVTYYPQSHEIRVSMNAGGPNRHSVGAVLTGASPELVCGRVLELYAEVSIGQIFASVHDRFLGGDFALDAVGPAAGGPEYPWGHSPSGTWFVMAGLRDTRHEGPSSLPVGFGLSNLRITLGSEVCSALGSLPYAGALDHLVSAEEDDFSTYDPDDLSFTTGEKSIPESLFELADQLDGLSEGARRWAARARGLAEETEQLAMVLPEDLGLEKWDQPSELHGSSLERSPY